MPTDSTKTARAELCTAIRSTFPPKTITQELIAKEWDSWKDYDQIDDLKSRVVGQTWPSLLNSVLEHHYHALIYAGPTSFKLLLPAYLVSLLGDEIFYEMPFVVAGELKRTEDASNQAVFDARFERMDESQRRVIRSTIALLRNRVPMENVMREAFDSYWGSWSP